MPSVIGASLDHGGTESTRINRRLSSLSVHEARQRLRASDSLRRLDELPSTSGNVWSTVRFFHRQTSSLLQAAAKAKSVESFQTVEVSARMGRCLYEAGEKIYNRVHKATGTYIRALVTPKGYIVMVNGPQDAIKKTVEMLHTAIVQTIPPSLGREIFGKNTESIAPISKHTGSMIVRWHIDRPVDETVVVALCPSSDSRKMVSDVLDNPPMRVGLSSLVVHWLRTKGPNGVRIDDIIKQTGAYIRIEDATNPLASQHCFEALIIGSQRAKETAKSLMIKHGRSATPSRSILGECDTVKKMEVTQSFASYFETSGEAKRLSTSSNALAVVEPAGSNGWRAIVIVGPPSCVAAAVEQVETKISSS